MRRSAGLERDRQAGPRNWGRDGRGRSGVRVAALCRAPARRVKQRGTAFRSARHRLRAVSPRAASRRARRARSRFVGDRSPPRCEAGAPSATPPIVPGASGSPREVNLIAKDYSFLPDALDLAPGETVLLHVINGGLEVHEAVIGDAATSRTPGRPPKPRPSARRPARRRSSASRPSVGGVRIVVQLRRAGRPRLDGPGRRRRPPPGSSAATSPVTGTRGMQIPVRWARWRGRPPERAGWYASGQRRRARDRSMPRGGS